MVNWYYSKNDKKVGPVTSDELVARINDGEVNSGALVWNKSLKTWEPIDEHFGKHFKSETSESLIKNDLELDTAHPPSLPTTNESQISGSYFVRHWRGDLSLPVSYWVNLVILNLITTTVIYYVSTQVHVQESPTQFSLIAIAVWILSAPIFLWQFVGTWRSASKYGKNASENATRWDKVAKFFLVLGLLRFTVEFSNSGIPQLEEYWSIATKNDGTYQLRVLRDATELEMSGKITFGLVDDIKKLLNSHPAIETIHLNSIGGRIVEARELATLIESHKLNTYTSTGCYSACVLPYAAGKERLIEKNVSLGFHKYHFPGADDSTFLDDYEIDKQFLLQKGIKSEFVEKMYQAENSDMWKPSHEELINAGYITKYPDFGDVAYSALRPNDINDLEKSLLSTQIFKTLKEHEPEAYEKIQAAFKKTLERGQSIGDLRSISIPILQEILFKRLPYSSDEALIGFARVMIDQLRYLTNSDPELCYKYLSGDTQSNLNFPSALYDRERSQMIQVIESYSEKRTVPSDEEIEDTLAAVFLPIYHDYDEKTLEFIVGTAKPSNTAEVEEYCNATIAIYEEVLKQAPSEAAKTLRYMFGSAPVASF